MTPNENPDEPHGERPDDPAPEPSQEPQPPQDPQEPQYGEYPAGPRDGDAPAAPQDESAADAADAAVASAKNKRIGIAAGGGIAAIVVVLAVVFGSLYATDTAPFSDSDSDISDVAHSYVDALNKQNVDDVRSAVCSDDAMLLAGAEDGPGDPNPIQLDQVSDVDARDGKATADLAVSANINGEQQSQTVPMWFKKEDGNWTVCESLAPQTGAPQGGAPQGGAPQGGAPQGGAPQGGAPQGGAPQGGAPQGGAPQGGAPQGGAPQGGGSDGGAPQPGN